MSIRKTNPKAPGKALSGFGVSQSSAACDLEYNPSHDVVQRLQHRFAISAPHASTVARLAGLGPQEARR